MRSHDRMDPETEILPFFPLSVFLMPGEDIPLRIFEPRYKQLIEDIRGPDLSFVIPYVIDREIQQTGCEVKLKEVVAENPGGRMVIIVQSLSVVRILSYSRQLEGKLYAGGRIERMPCSDPVAGNELKVLINEYREHFDEEFPPCCGQGEITLQDVMKALNLPSEDKFRFVCMAGNLHKEAYLASQLRYLKMIRKQESLLGNDFGLN
jgi:hypothetical protein